MLISFEQWSPQRFFDEVEDPTDNGGVGGGAAVAEPEGDYDFLDPSFDEPADSDDAEAGSDDTASDDALPSDDTDATDDVDEPVSADNTPDERTLRDFSPDLLQRASRLGFTAEEVLDFGSDRALSRAIAGQERLISHFADMQDADEGDTSSKPNADSKQAGPDVDALIQQLRDNEFGEEIIDPIAALHQQNQMLMQRLDEMSQATQQFRDSTAQAQQREQANQMLTWFDRGLSELPDSYQKLVGEGPTGSVDRESAEFKNRDRLYHMAHSLQSNWQANGFTGPHDTKILEAAAHAAFGAHARTAARQEVKSKMRRNGGQTVSRPSQNRNGETVDPRERAAQAVENFWKKQDRGLTSSPFEDVEF